MTPLCFQALRLDYLVQKVRPILNKLMGSGTGPQRGLFNVPVDPVKLGIPDYFERVPYPMDLVSTNPFTGYLIHVSRMRVSSTSLPNGVEAKTAVRSRGLYAWEFSVPGKFPCAVL